MILKTQIITFVFSLIFGFIFSFLIDINYKIIYESRKLYKIPITFMLVIGSAMVYFYILEKLNYGIIHIYLIIAIIIGFTIEHYLYTIIEKKIKK